MIGSYDSGAENGTGPGRIPRAAAPASDRDGSATQVQYLAVFILLLGFFILLNALSRFDAAKVGEVLESVEGSFATGTDSEGAATDRARTAALAEAAKAVQALGELILTEIPLAKVEVSTDGRTMMLVVPVGELFAGGAAGSDLRPDRTALLNRTADVLLPRAAGVRVRLEALLGTGSTADTAANAPLVAGAGAIARGLVHHGAPADALTVGMETGTTGQVRLLFNITAGGRPVSLTSGLLIQDPAP